MKIIGIIPVYNDEDILKEIIDYYISQGLELVILDNGSTDNSYKICEKFVGLGVKKLIKFKTDNYISKWDSILRALYDIAIEQNPDWIIKIDSDEFLESGQVGVSLKEGIEQVASQGYNYIQFDRFDFFMTDNDNKNAESVRQKLQYYSCQGDYLYRAWKYYPGVMIESFAFVHFPILPDDVRYKIYPKKFVMRHYQFTSEKQALKKIEDRTRGTNYEKTKKGLNYHYKNLVEHDCSKRMDHKLLTKYNEDGIWNYDLKFHPYMDSLPWKKDDIFSKDGKLKIKFKTRWELEMQLHEIEQHNIKFKIIRKLIKIRESIKKKFSKT